MRWLPGRRAEGGVRVKRLLPYVFLLALPVAWAPARAQDTGSDQVNERLEQVLENQRIMMERLAPDPLKGRHFGVEFNLPRALLYDEFHSLSGGVSLFPPGLNAEIAFPVFYGRSDTDPGPPHVTTWLVDAHYRYFLAETRHGFYISGFVRYAHLSGTLERQPGDGTVSKLGLGCGIGYRVFSKRGPYWGTSLSLGRYVLGRNDRFAGDDFGDDMAAIVDVELLKFGWAF